MQETFLLLLWLNHETSMSESPQTNAVFHVSENLNGSSSGFIRGANIGAR